MARKPKTNQVSADELLRALYPDLPTSEDYTDPLAAAMNDGKKDTPAASDPKLAALEQQVAALQGQLQQTARVNGALMTQASTDLPPQRPVIDYSQAPDPTVDHAAFAKFMAEANAATLQYEKDLYNWQAKQQNDVATKTANLWDTFAHDYPELAKNSKRVEIAAAEVISKARLAGKDVDKYMFAGSPQFLKDVADEINSLWGAPSNKDDDDDDDYAEDRTDMLGGGAGGQSVASTKGRQAPPEKYGALSQDVLAWQKATGYHG